MKELRDQRQESRFPSKQEIYIAPQTTFKKLGIEDLREKRLGLDNEPIIVISVNDSQNKSTNYFAFYDHPFVGAHLAHALNAEAPIKVDPAVAKNAILADFDMPLSARRTIKSWKPPRTDASVYKRYVHFDNLHVGDPEIKLHYKEFVEQGLKQEIDALETSTYDPIFDQSMRLRFVNTQKAGSEFARLLLGFRLDRTSGLLAVTRTSTFNEIQLSLFNSPIHAEFVEFLRTQLDINGESRSQAEIDIWESKFGSVSDNTRSGLMLSFLEQLHKEGQERFVLSKAIREPLVPSWGVIDLKNKRVFGNWKDGIKPSFSDNNGFELHDNNGIKIQFEIQEGPDELYLPYRVTGYKFPEEPLQGALYPVMAWKKDENGQRRFLSQNELLGFLPHLNFDRSKRPDVYLGRNLLGYFSKDITDKWPSEIALEGHPRPQKMMGAQVSVRDSLDSDKYPHARQLLAGSVVQKLEEHALSSAA